MPLYDEEEVDDEDVNDEDEVGISDDKISGNGTVGRGIMVIGNLSRSGSAAAGLANVMLDVDTCFVVMVSVTGGRLVFSFSLFSFLTTRPL